MTMTISGLRKVILGMAIIGLNLIATASFTVSASDEDISFKEVREEMREAGEAIQNYSAQQRDEAIEQVKSSIERMDAYIERMEERLDKKADQMDDAARRKARATLQAIKEQRNDVAQWYDRMKDSTADAWEEIKTGFLKSYRNLVNAFDKAEDEY